MQITLPEGQHLAAASEVYRVADIVAEAFENDPVNRFVFGTPRAIRSGMRVLARAIYMPQRHCFLHGDVGATMWLPPGAVPNFGTLAQLQFALGMARFATPGAMKRGMALSGQMNAHHPGEPHMYLFAIGTCAAARGTGVGKALLAPVLEACDREGMPVYLENSNPVNTGFYRAHGFETVTKFEVGGPGGPVMEPMWRAPR